MVHFILVHIFSCSFYHARDVLQVPWSSSLRKSKPIVSILNSKKTNVSNVMAHAKSHNMSHKKIFWLHKHISMFYLWFVMFIIFSPHIFIWEMFSLSPSPIREDCIFFSKYVSSSKKEHFIPLYEEKRRALHMKKRGDLLHLEIFRKEKKCNYTLVVRTHYHCCLCMRINLLQF